MAHSNPDLAEDVRQALVIDLMRARRERDRDAVDRAKRALGERGPVWWSDGMPDLNRHMARNTPYADWFAAIAEPRPEAGPTFGARRTGAA